VNTRHLTRTGWLVLLVLGLTACAPQGVGPFTMPQTIQLSENDRLTAATRARIEALNAQLEQMAGLIGQRKYLALP
jgi:hypothetical protein